MSQFTFDDRDAAIVAQRMATYDKRPGPRVGDFVRLKDGTLRRFTHDWGKDIQTTMPKGFDASFYLGDGYVEFSGGLDSAIMKSTLKQLETTMPGRVWIFHHGYVGGGRGVHTLAEFRVFDQI